MEKHVALFWGLLYYMSGQAYRKETGIMQPLACTDMA